jgi:hypothetical protein
MLGRATTVTPVDWPFESFREAALDGSIADPIAARHRQQFAVDGDVHSLSYFELSRLVKPHRRGSRVRTGSPPGLGGNPAAECGALSGGDAERATGEFEGNTSFVSCETAQMPSRLTTTTPRCELA